MKQKYSAGFLTGLLLAALPSVTARAGISELLRELPSKYCSAEDGRRPVVKSQADMAPAGRGRRRLRGGIAAAENACDFFRGSHGAE